MWGRTPFQAERKGSAKALRLECASRVVVEAGAGGDEVGQA